MADADQLSNKEAIARISDTQALFIYKRSNLGRAVVLTAHHLAPRPSLVRGVVRALFVSQLARVGQAVQYASVGARDVTPLRAVRPRRRGRRDASDRGLLVPRPGTVREEQLLARGAPVLGAREQLLAQSLVKRALLYTVFPVR